MSLKNSRLIFALCACVWLGCASKGGNGVAECADAGGNCILGPPTNCQGMVGPQDCNPDQNPGGALCCLLKDFERVTVIHGHTHQVLTNRIGNIHFHGMLSTAWPWPYAPEGLPRFTVQMNPYELRPFDDARFLASIALALVGSSQS